LRREIEEEIRKTQVLLGAAMIELGHNLQSQGLASQISYEPMTVTKEKGEEMREKMSVLNQKLNTLTRRLEIMSDEKTVKKAA
jgi:hypothetical protein